MDFVGTQVAATKLIASFGTVCTFTRAGSNIFKSPVAFTQDSKTIGSGGNIRVSSLIVGQVVGYVSGAVKVPPQPEDNVTNKGRAYNIIAVDTIKPADVVLAYKLTME